MRAIAVPKSRFAEKKNDDRKQGQVDDGIGLQTRLLGLTMSGYWTALHTWSRRTTHLSPPDMALVLKASTPQGFLKITQLKDQKKLALLQKSAEDEGFRHQT